MKINWPKIGLPITLGLAIAIVFVIFFNSKNAGEDFAAEPVSIPADEITVSEPDIVPTVTTSEKENGSREYGVSDTAFFTEPDAVLFFNFAFKAELLSDLNAWYPTVEIYYEDSGKRRPVEFQRENNDHMGIGQLILKLKNAPARDLFVVLKGAEGRNAIRKTFHYSEPFQYQASSVDPVYNMLMEARIWIQPFQNRGGSNREKKRN